MQSDKDVAPDVGNQVPALQLIQCVGKDAPTIEDQVPGLQARHCEITLAPPTDDQYPRLHAVQEDAPELDQVPALH